MAISGSIYGTTSNQYIDSAIDWTATSDIGSNTSTVTAKLYYRRNNTGFTTYGTGSFSVTINGTTFSSSGVTLTIGTSWVLAMTATTKVTHNDDGTKSIVISATGSIPGTTFSSTNCSGTVKLETIPRTSSVSATNADIESNTTITISRASSSFTHTLTYSFKGASGTIATKTKNTSIIWKVPESFYAKIPNETSGTCTITCDTYNGTQKIGSSTDTFTATANKSNCAPGVYASANVTDSKSIELTGNNKTIISGISNIEVKPSAMANKSSTISSITAYCGSASKSVDNFGSVTFVGASSKEVYVVVTDSRGYSTRYDVTSLSLVNYIVPTLINSVTRDTPTGDTVTVSVRGKWYNGSFGVEDNYLTVRMGYKVVGGSYGNYQNIPITINGNDYSGELRISGIDYTKAYSFMIFLGDPVHEDWFGFVYPSLSKGVPVFDWGEDDFRFNVPVLVDDNNYATGGFEPGMRMWFGRVNIAPTAVNQITSSVIYLPTGYFTESPCAFVTPSSTVPNRVRCSCMPTKDKVTVYLAREDDTTETTVYIFAIGK